MKCGKSLPSYKDGADCHSVCVIDSNLFRRIFICRVQVLVEGDGNIYVVEVPA